MQFDLRKLQRITMHTIEGSVVAGSVTHSQSSSAIRDKSRLKSVVS